LVTKKGWIFNIEKYAIHDGPGIRTTVFFKGCRLRCWWCHNPEGQNPTPELIYRQNRCIGCGECVARCAREALSLTYEHVTLNWENCSMCGVCAQTCPSEALSIVGKEMSVKETINEIGSDIAFYEESEGGVTFSGGEPLLQLDFLNSVLHECNERGFHTTLDTSGYASQEAIERIRDKVDLFLYDIKTMNDANHRKYTGVSNKPILQNLQRLAEKGSSIVISLPIIPHINDDENNILRTGGFVSSLHNINYVSLLPYHRTAIDKYKSMSRPYKLKRIQPPSSQKINLIKEKLETFGLRVKIGGR
jgi:pyruvate formate lyase activating enzyme